jgi:hypothetical protein
MHLLKSALLGLALLAVPVSAQVNVDRAIRNYRALQSGQIQLQDLTPLEREEVAEVDRLIRADARDRLSPAERCLRRNRTSERPSPLEQRLLDLKCSQR